MLQKVRMTPDIRLMNQGMSNAIDARIRLAFDLNRQEVHCWTLDDGFAQDTVITMFGKR